MKKPIVSAIAILLLSVAFMGRISAQSPIEKTWYNQEKTSVIQVYLAKDGKYYGKLIKLKDAVDKDTGKPRTDKENPDDAKKNTPLIGLLILQGFSINPENKAEYIDGKVYDPKNGKTYCGKLTLKDGVLDLRGFICSMSFLGRTSQWTEAKEPYAF